MKTDNLENEIKDFLDEWNRAIIDKNVAAAAQLREDGYSATLPNGHVLTKQEEITLIGSSSHTIESLSTENLTVRKRWNTAIASFDHLIEGEYAGEPIKILCKGTMSFRRRAGRWRARSLRLADKATGPRGMLGGASERGANRSFKGARSFARTIKSWVKGRIMSMASEGGSSFQELAFVPYKPGLDFVIPQRHGNGSEAGSSELPIPPQELWLGYNYPKHGKAHVSKMLEIVYASGFSFKPGDRVLDFGCGAGRMIRHLKDLAETCEIWGTDISAEHIYWCKQHVSPPFNFATTTKIPHLPFEDRSFQLIYCGSVFTHIDDLADAWLLELQRILAPDGRLYLTIHDDHSIELFDSGRYDSSVIVMWIKSHEVYQRSKDSFGMFTVGRDSNSQVFYDLDYFSKMLGPMFEIISITREAYFYQTALLLKRREK